MGVLPLCPKHPRLLELAILFKQALKLILHCHVVCLMEFACECIHSHPEKFSNSVADPGESRAKHLLLAFENDLGSSIMAQDMIAVLRDQSRWPDVRLQEIQRGSRFGRVNIFFLAFQDCGFENGEGF